MRDMKVMVAAAAVSGLVILFWVASGTMSESGPPGSTDPVPTTVPEVGTAVPPDPFEPWTPPPPETTEPAAPGEGLVVIGLVHGPDGLPAENVLVRVVRVWEGRNFLVVMSGSVTDGEGRFRIERVPTDGICLALFPKRSGGGTPDDLARGAVQVVDRVIDGSAGPVVDVGILDLAAPEAVSGRVEDENGAPISGVRVTSILPGTGLGRKSAMTGRDGAFRFEGLLPANYTILASRSFPEIGVLNGAARGVRPGDPPVTIRLVPAGAVCLRFFSIQAPGTPLMLLKATLVSIGGTGTISFKGGGGSGKPGRTLWRVPLKPGPHQLRLLVPGYLPLELGQVTIFGDRDTELSVELTLE